jgi:hypothetical protein
MKQISLMDVLHKEEGLELKNDVIRKPGPILINLDSIIGEEVEWLWFNRIPMGKLSLIVGDPGLGKSFLTIYLASHVTNGKPWPDTKESIPKGSVIILTAEDGLADTVRIRADVAAANVKNIKILEGVISKDGEKQFFNLDDHIHDLEQAIRETDNTRLIIIDPVTSYLGKKIDGHKNSQVRGTLAPLSELAQKYNIAIVAVSHLNKNTAINAIYRTMGSLAFTAAARSVWAVTLDKDHNRRLFVPVKTNLSVNPTSLAFDIKDGQVVFEDQPIEIDVDEALSEEKREEASALGHAKTWLKDALADGSIASKEIYNMAEQNGISKATLRRAKENLKINARKEGAGGGQQWFWELQNDE